MGDIEELLGATAFLSDDTAGFVNRHILYVDDGLTVTLLICIA
jgi:gluconate 5-dehydrogenase